MDHRGGLRHVQNVTRFQSSLARLARWPGKDAQEGVLDGQ